MARTLGISEARRLLPQLVDEVARDGGRIDITRRGEPVVSIVRATHAASAKRSADDAHALPDALRAELACDPDDLPAVIRELRHRVGRPRKTRSRR
jgi:prevent-host-death family protein